MNDYPPVQCIINESHLGYSTYGACGVGEDTGASLLLGFSSTIHHRTIGNYLHCEAAIWQTLMEATD